MFWRASARQNIGDYLCFCGAQRHYANFIVNFYDLPVPKLVLFCPTLRKTCRSQKNLIPSKLSVVQNQYKTLQCYEHMTGGHPHEPRFCPKKGKQANKRVDRRVQGCSDSIRSSHVEQRPVRPTRINKISTQSISGDSG